MENSVFKEQGAKIPDKEIENLKKSFQQKMSEGLKKLPEDELKNIAGGSLKEAAFAGADGALGGALLGTLIGGISGAADFVKSNENLGSGVKRFLTTMAKSAAAGALVGCVVGAGSAVTENVCDTIDTHIHAHKTNTNR